MIWNDTQLRNYAACGMVDPFDPSLVNPASIDLRLGAEYRLPATLAIVDKVEAISSTGIHAGGWGEERTMGEHGLTLYPGQFVLCHTLETVRIPSNASAALYSKSSTGRRGLEHLHAGWIDPGFVGQLTLEFKVVSPWHIKVMPGERLMQMVVCNLTGPAALDYSKTGRYQNQTGATPARDGRP